MGGPVDEGGDDGGDNDTVGQDVEDEANGNNSKINVMAVGVGAGVAVAMILVIGAVCLRQSMK